MDWDYKAFTKEVKSLFFELLPLYIGNADEEIGTKIKPADGTPVTSLDHYVLKRLRKLIAKNFPNDYTIGEEDQKNPEEIKKILTRQNQYQWTIDGLDGTGSLILGTNSYGAMICLRCGSKILYAAGFRPIDYQLRGNGFFWTQYGKGAWEWFEADKKDHQLHTVKAGKLKRMTILLEGSSKKFFRPPITFLGNAETTRASLSSFIAATTVARGKASALVTVENKPWDNWPSIIFIQEAGGIVTDWYGNPWTPENCGNIVAAANKKDGDHIINILNKKGG
ncbi:MAG: inositol monophosphatase family protein [Patescibacteria group bacterium]